MKRRAAFTLVELSIVLVIIGLLVGGVMAGQSLILASQRRRVITEWNDTQAAVLSFRDKYLSLPGDMYNAASFWPGVTNGNGDGLIGNKGSFSYSGYGIPGTEPCNFWLHLSSAGLVKGSYTVCDGAARTTAQGHMPQLPFDPNTGYIIVAECTTSDCMSGNTRPHAIWAIGQYNNAASTWLDDTNGLTCGSNRSPRKMSTGWITSWMTGRRAKEK